MPNCKNSCQKVKVCTDKGFEFGYLHGMIQVFLFNCTSDANGQSCLVHPVCGKTVCVGEMVLLETRISDAGAFILQGIRIKDGLRFCRFGSVETKNLSRSVISRCDGGIFQVVQLSVEESTKSEDCGGVIKLVLIGEASGPQLRQ